MARKGLVCPPELLEAQLTFAAFVCLCFIFCQYFDPVKCFFFFQVSQLQYHTRPVTVCLSHKIIHQCFMGELAVNWWCELMSQ